jgi:hypothetical protein
MAGGRNPNPSAPPSGGRDYFVGMEPGLQACSGLFSGRLALRGLRFFLFPAFFSRLFFSD